MEREIIEWSGGREEGRVFVVHQELILISLWLKSAVIVKGWELVTSSLV